MRRTTRLLFAGLAVIAAGACDQAATTAPDGAGRTEGVAFSHAGGPEQGHLKVCKEGTDANFEVTVDGGTPTTLFVAAETCEEAFATPAPGTYTVVVEELASPTYKLLSAYRTIWVDDPPKLYDEGSVTNPVTTTINDDLGVLIEFVNEPVVLDPGTLEVCKYGTDADFTIAVAGVTDPAYAHNDTFSLTAGDCIEAFVTPVPGLYDIVVTEVASPDYTLVGTTRLVRLKQGGDLVNDTPPGPAVSVSLNDDVEAFLTFTNEPVVEEDGEGCTPGYWKNHAGADSFSEGGRKKPTSWQGYDPNDSFSTVFGVGPDVSLMDALTSDGGGAIALGRHAVAALLNAAHSGVSYDLGEAAVVQIVQDAYGSGDFEGAKNQLAGLNEQGCPL